MENQTQNNPDEVIVNDPVSKYRKERDEYLESLREKERQRWDGGTEN